MKKENRIKIFKFRMLLRKLNTDDIKSLLNVLNNDWQVTLIRLELERRG